MHIAILTSVSSIYLVRKSVQQQCNKKIVQIFLCIFKRSTATTEECGFLCQMDSTATCGYYVHENGNCHLGTLDNSPVAVPPGTPDATVYVFNSKFCTCYLFTEHKCRHMALHIYQYNVCVSFFEGFDRHASREGDFILNTDYGPSIWPKFIYAQHTNVPDGHACSSICLLADGPCHLYFLSGTTCYLGRYNFLNLK